MKRAEISMSSLKTVSYTHLKKTESALQKIIPKDRPGDFNQAMMELGAVVCVPNGQPKCDLCPVRCFCQAGLHGTMEKFPVKAPKKPRVVEERTVLVIQDGSCTAIRKRPPKGLLAGLYELPNTEGYLNREGEFPERKSD